MKKRHLDFVRHYLNKDSPTYKNAAACARECGYAEKSAASAGCLLLKRPDVKELLLKKQDRQIDVRIKGWFSKKQEFIKEGVRQYEVLPSTSQIKLKYYELIGKALGFFESTVQNTTICSINITGGVEKFALGIAQTLNKNHNPSNPSELEQNAKKSGT